MQLAAAASAVAVVGNHPKITVDKWPRQITATGKGFVQLVRQQRDDSELGYMDVWAVIVACPQDLTAAEKWIEDHRDQLVAALEAHMVVTTVEPIQLVLDEGSVNALSIEGARAH